RRAIARDCKDSAMSRRVRSSPEPRACLPRRRPSDSGTFPTTGSSQTMGQGSTRGRSMHFFDHRRLTRNWPLVALLACSIGCVHAQAVRAPGPQAAPVPEAVAIPRPTAAEVDLVRSSLAQFLASADAATVGVIDKYPGLL